MNINGDLNAEPSPPRLPKRRGPSRPVRWLLDVAGAVGSLFVDEPVWRLHPYQFRLEPTAAGGAVLVLHVRDRRGRVEIKFTFDDLQGLDLVVDEVLHQLARRKP